MNRLNYYFTNCKEGNQRAEKVINAISHTMNMDGLEKTPNPEEADVMLLYGMSASNKKTYLQYNNSKHVFIGDLGYWGRYSIRNDATHYKISYRHWHPNTAIDNHSIPSKQRAIPSFQPIRPVRQESPILLAGMGVKGCVLYEQGPQEWDRWAVKEIRKHTDRKIYYRPKPSWRDAPSIQGAVMRDIGQYNLKELLKECDTVVTHHSNCGLDAAINGVGCYAKDGVGALLSMKDLSQIDNPVEELRNRKELIRKISYFNWSVNEMFSGECWNFMRHLMEQRSFDE